MDVSIRQACRRGACYLCGKTGHFVHKCLNQKAQIRAVLYAMTSKKRQAWVDEVRELNKSSAKKEQPVKKVPLKEDFTET